MNKSDVSIDQPKSSSSVVGELKLTPAAVAHVEKKIAARGQGVGIRLSVKTAGCSGMQYVFDYVDNKEEEDYDFPINNNLSLFVEKKSFAFVKGSQIDYVSKGISRMFELINPNEKGACGCGESFYIED